MPPPAPAQRDLLVGSGCSNLQAAVPHPPGPSPGLLLVLPRGRSGSRARRAVPLPRQTPQIHVPPSCCCQSAWPPPSPQTRTPRSKCQPLQGLGPSVKRAGEEHCHQEPPLAPWSCSSKRGPRPGWASVAQKPLSAAFQTGRGFFLVSEPWALRFLYSGKPGPFPNAPPPAQNEDEKQ